MPLLLPTGSMAAGPVWSSELALLAFASFLIWEQEVDGEGVVGLYCLKDLHATTNIIFKWKNSVPFLLQSIWLEFIIE